MPKFFKVSDPISVDARRGQLYEFKPIGFKDLGGKQASLVFLDRGIGANLAAKSAKQRGEIFSHIWQKEHVGLKNRAVIEIQGLNAKGEYEYSYHLNDKLIHKTVSLNDEVPIGALDANGHEIKDSHTAKPHYYRVQEMALRQFKQVALSHSIVEFLKALLDWLATPFVYLLQLIAGSDQRAFAEMLAPIQHDRVGEMSHDVVLEQMKFIGRLLNEEDRTDYGNGMGMQESRAKTIRMFGERFSPYIETETHCKIFLGGARRRPHHANDNQDPSSEIWKEHPVWVSFNANDPLIQENRAINKLRERRLVAEDATKIELKFEYEWLQLPKNHPSVQHLARKDNKVIFDGQECLYDESATHIRIYLSGERDVPNPNLGKNHDRREFIRQDTPYWVRFDKNDPLLSELKMRKERPCKLEHQGTIEMKFDGDWLVLPKDHDWVKQAVHTVRIDEIDSQQSNPKIFSATQKMSQLFLEAHTIGKQMGAALNSGSKTAEDEIITHLAAKIGAVNVLNHFIIPLAQGEGRDYLPHFLVFTHNPEKNKTLLKHICLSSTNIEKGKMQSVTTYDVTNTVGDAVKCKKMARALFHTQPYARNKDAEDVKYTGSKIMDTSLDELLSHYGQRMNSKKGPATKASRDPVKALLMVAQELKMKENPRLSSEHRILENLLSSKANFYATYVNHLISYYEENESRFIPTQRVQALDGIQWYAQKVRHYLENELGVDAAIAITENLLEFVEKKLEESGRREAQEKEDVRNLKSKASLFEATLASSIQSVLKQTQTEHVVEASRINQIEWAHLEHLRQQLLKNDLQENQRAECLQLFKKLRLRIDQCLDQKDLLAAKTLSLALMQALPAADDPHVSKTFWDTLNEQELSGWAMGLTFLADKMFQACLRSGHYPLKPHEVFEFNVTIPLLERYLLTRKIPFQLAEFDKIITTYMNNADVMRQLTATRQHFIQWREKEIEFATSIALKEKWKKQDQEDRAIFREYQAKKTAYDKALKEYNAHCSDPDPSVRIQYPYPGNEPVDPKVRSSRQKTTDREQELISVTAESKRVDVFLNELKNMDLNNLGEKWNVMMHHSCNRTQAVMGHFAKIIGISKELYSYKVLGPSWVGFSLKDKKHAIWLMEKDCSVLVGSTPAFEARYAACKRTLEGLNENFSGSCNHMVNFLIGYKNKGDGTQLKPNDFTPFSQEVNRHFEGFFNWDAGYAPNEISSIRRVDEMRKILRDPTRYLVPYWEDGIIGNIMSMFAADKIEAESIRKQFAAMKEINLFAASRTVGGSNVGCFTLSENPDEGHVATSEKEELPATHDERVNFMGQITPEMVKVKVGADHEREVVDQIAQQRLYAILDPAQEFVLRETALSKSGSHEREDKLSYLAISQCLHFIYQYPEKLEIPQIQHTLYKTFLQQGLINNHLKKNPEFFVRMGSVLNEICTFLQRKGEAHQASELFVREICDKIRRHAMDLQETLKRTYGRDWASEIAAALPVYNEEKIVGVFRQRLNSSMQKEFAIFALNYYCTNIPNMEDVDALRDLFKAYYILQRSPVALGHSGLQAELLYKVQKDILPRVELRLKSAQEPLMKNNLLYQLSGKAGGWRANEQKPYCYIVEDGNQKFEIDLRSGEGFKCEIVYGDKCKLPEQIRSHNDFRFLFQSHDPLVMSVKDPSNPSIVDYIWKDEKTNSEFSFRYQSDTHALQIFQTSGGKKYQYQRLTLSDSKWNKAWKIFARHNNTTIENLITSQGVWVYMDENKRHDTSKVLLAQHGWSLADPITLEIKKDQITAATVGEGKEKKWVCSGLSDKDAKLLSCRTGQGLLLLSKNKKHVDEIRFPMDLASKEQLILKRSEQQEGVWYVSGREDWVWQLTNTKTYEDRFGKNWREFILPLKNQRTGEEEMWIFPHLAVSEKKRGSDVKFLKSAVDYMDILGGPGANLQGMRNLVGAAESFMGGAANLLEGIEQIAGEANVVNNQNGAHQNRQEEMAAIFKQLTSPKGIRYRSDARTETSSHAGFFYLAYVSSLRGDWGVASRYLQLMLENGHSNIEDFKQFQKMIQFTLQQLIKDQKTERSVMESAFFSKLGAALFTLNQRLQAQHGMALFDKNAMQALGVAAAIFYGEYSLGLSTHLQRLKERGLLLSKKEEAILNPSGVAPPAVPKPTIADSQKNFTTQFKMPSAVEIQVLTQVMARNVQPHGVSSIHDLHKEYGSYPKWETVVANFWCYWEWIYRNDLAIEDISFLFHSIPGASEQQLPSDFGEDFLNQAAGLESLKTEAVDIARRFLLLFWHYSKTNNFNADRKQHDLAMETLLKQIKELRLEMPDFASIQSKKEQKQLDLERSPNVIDYALTQYYEQYLTRRINLNAFEYQENVGGVVHTRGVRKDFVQASETLLRKFLLEATKNYHDHTIGQASLNPPVAPVVNLPPLPINAQAQGNAAVIANVHPKTVPSAYERVEVKPAVNHHWDDYFVDSLKSWNTQERAWEVKDSPWEERKKQAQEKYFAPKTATSEREKFKLEQICVAIDEMTEELKKRTSRSLDIKVLSHLLQKISKAVENLDKEHLVLQKKMLDFSRLHAEELGLVSLFVDRNKITDKQVIKKILDLYRNGELGRLDDKELSDEFASLITETLLTLSEMQQYEKAIGACKDLAKIWKQIDRKISNAIEGEERDCIAQSMANNSVDWLIYSADLKRFLEQGANRLRYAEEVKVGEDKKYYLSDQRFTRRYLVSDVQNQWICRDIAIAFVEDMLRDLKEAGKGPIRFNVGRMGIGKTVFGFKQAIDILLQKNYEPIMVTTDELVDQLNDTLGNKAFVFKFSIDFGLDVVHAHELAQLNPVEKEKRLEELQKPENILEHLHTLAKTLESLKSEKKIVLTSPSQIAALRDKRVQLQMMLEMMNPGVQRHAIFLQLQAVKRIEAYFKGERTVYLIDEDVNFDISLEYNYATGDFRTIDSIRFDVAERMMYTLKEKHPDLWGLVVNNNLRAIRNISLEFREVARNLFRDPEFWKNVGWSSDTWSKINEEEFLDYILGIKETLPKGMPAWDIKLGPDKQQEKIYVASLRTFFSKTLDAVCGVNPKLERGISSNNGITVVPYNDGCEKKGVLYGEESENLMHHLCAYAGTDLKISEEIFLQKKKDFGNLDAPISPFYPETWKMWANKIANVASANPEYKNEPYQAFIKDPSLAWERIQFLRHMMLETDFIRVFHEQITFNSQDLGIGVDVRIGSGTGQPFALNLLDYTDQSARSAVHVLAETILCMSLDRKTTTFNGTPLEYIEKKAHAKKCSAILNYDYAVLESKSEKLAARLRQNKVDRQIVYRTEEAQELVKKMWNPDQNSPTAYDPEAIHRNALFIYSPSDSRGDDRKVPRGRNSYGVALVGVGNQVDNVTQLAWRLRHLDLGHKLRLAHDKKTKDQIHKVCAERNLLQAEEDVTIGHSMRYFILNTLKDEEIKNVKASIFKQQTPLKTYLDAEVRKPYDMNGIENAAALETLEGKVVMKTVRNLYIFNNFPQWIKEYQAHQSVDPIAFIESLCVEELKKIKLMDQKFTEEIQNLCRSQNQTRLLVQKNLLNWVVLKEIPDNGAVDFGAFENKLKAVLKFYAKSYPEEEIAVAREYLRKYFMIKVGFVKAAYEVREEQKRLKEPKYQQFLRNHLPEKITVDPNDGSRNEQKIQQLQEQKREQKQEKVERVVVVAPGNRPTRALNFDHFKDVVFGSKSIYKTAAAHYDWSVNGNFLPLNIAMQQELKKELPAGYENFYISQRACHLLAKMGHSGAPSFDLLVFEDGGGKCHSVIITPAEREESIAINLIKEREAARKGNLKAVAPAAASAVTPDDKKEAFQVIKDIVKNIAAGFKAEWVPVIDQTAENNKALLMPYIDLFLSAPNFDKAWDDFMQIYLPGLITRFQMQTYGWVITRAIDQKRKAVLDIYTKYHKKPAAVSAYKGLVGVYALSNENFSRMVVDAVNRPNEKSKHFLDMIVKNKLFLNWTQFSLEELEHLIDYVQNNSQKMDSFANSILNVHGQEEYVNLETMIKEVRAPKTAELIKRIAKKEPEWVFSVVQRKLNENYVHFRPEEKKALKEWVMKMRNTELHFEEQRLLRLGAKQSADLIIKMKKDLQPMRQS